MRRRILTATVGITAVAVMLFGLPLGIAVGRLYKSREASRLQREAISAGGALSAGGLHGGDPVELPRAPAHVRLALYDEKGHLVSGAGPGRTFERDVTRALTGDVTEAQHGGWLAVTVPVRDEELVVGAARAALPWGVVTGRVHTTWLAMLGLGLLAMGVAGGLGWSQARRLAAPVDDLAAAAVRLGDGDFAAALEPPGVPELDRAAGALNRTAERLGELVSRERAFTADASHQLATPLTSLRLGLESALITPRADPRSAIDDAIREVERLERTVATLFALARDLPVTPSACDAARSCREVAEQYRGDLAAEGRPLSVVVDPALPQAQCAPAALREVLSVLMDNALRHGRGQVTVRARGAGPGVIVEVEDEGEGIVGDPEAAFARRGPGAAGHGIGLALARSVADAHGARLQLRRAAPHPLFTVAMPGAPAP